MLTRGKEVAPSVAWEILLRIKRAGGLSVNELRAATKMSYMGIKQHCDSLKKRGYLDTWRRPKKTGRPEKIYRPADKLDELLPQWSNDLSLGLLTVVTQLNGETAAERLLHHFFLQKRDKYAVKIKGTTLKQRVQELCKMRISDGCISELRAEVGAPVTIIDHHHPGKELARLYPAVIDMEQRMLEVLIGAEVERIAHEFHVEFQFIEKSQAVVQDEFRLEA